MIPRSPIIPAPFFPPEPCSTAASSRASCSYHRFSSRAISRVTGTSAIRRPSCASDERMKVAVSGSAPLDDASSSVTAVSRSFNSPARRTISRALTISASRSFNASFISSCADCVDDSTPRTRPSKRRLPSVPKYDGRGHVATYQCQNVPRSMKQFSGRLRLSGRSRISYSVAYS
jgi:hypothetical protein